MIKRLAPSSPFCNMYVLRTCTYLYTRLTANNRERVTEAERDVAPRHFMFLTYGNPSIARPSDLLGYDQNKQKNK